MRRGIGFRAAAVLLRGAMCGVRACGGSWKSSYDGWWRIEFGYGSGGSRHTKAPPLVLPPSDTKQGETKERGGEGGELLTTPIWRRFRAGAGAAFSSLPDQSRGCVCVCALARRIKCNGRGGNGTPKKS